MKAFFAISLLLFCTEIAAQNVSTNDSAVLIVLNQSIDDLVIAQNVAGLQKLYADHFVFTHGSGRVDNKTSWLKSVANGGFTQRLHDSMTVELHGNVGIVRGKLKVSKTTKSGINKYYLYYVRVFSKLKADWQLISHITTSEFREPAAK